jgi:hypothetical protein
MYKKLLHNYHFSSSEKFLPLRTLAAPVSIIVVTTKHVPLKTHAQGWSERQTPETCTEENLTGRALQDEEAGAVTVGPRR